MENKLAIKVWDMDYSFLMKNYLNPELWDKEWTLFQYKTFVVTLRIFKIYTKWKEIEFEIRVYNHDVSSEYRDNYTDKSVNVSLNLEIQFVKNKINSAVYDAIYNMEKTYFIEETDEYNELTDKIHEERDKLKQIAYDFLEEKGVTSDACIEAYVDAYVDENEQIYGLREDYVDACKYTMLPDLYLTFLSTVQDNDRLARIHDKLGKSRYDEVMEEIKEYTILMEDEDAFKEEMSSKLEDI